MTPATFAELQIAQNHHDHHYQQMEIAYAEGRTNDAQFHRLEMGKHDERLLEIEHAAQDEYRRAHAPFMRGQRVRFVACPSLTGTVTARRHCHVEEEWRYTVVGDAEETVLGDDYGREDLEGI